MTAEEVECSMFFFQATKTKLVSQGTVNTFYSRPSAVELLETGMLPLINGNSGIKFGTLFMVTQQCDSLPTYSCIASIFVTR